MSQVFAIFCSLCIVLCNSITVEDIQNKFPGNHLDFHNWRKWSSVDSSEHCSVGDDLCKDSQKAASRNCWGYEDGCEMENVYSKPRCDALSTVGARVMFKSIEQQREAFWRQADFGYVKTLKENALEICTPEEDGDSALICVTKDKLCYASNMFIDLSNVKFKAFGRLFDIDWLKPGVIGGHCRLNQILHDEQDERRGELSGSIHSWYAELKRFQTLPIRTFDEENCEVIFEKPVWIVKLDSTTNIYHHFCNFVNLFITQHFYGDFSTDVTILIWDGTRRKHTDYCSDVWPVFTQHPLRWLHEFEGKRLCFRKAIFSHLPRVPGGLYYNSPIIPNCHHSGLFQAFTEHIIHRLKVVRRPSEKIRVILISRGTPYRNILNEHELEDAMKQNEQLDVKRVRFHVKDMAFREQMELVRNTDILIGIHGAGMTHMLFLPDWGVVIELHDIGEGSCYNDLARLRGLAHFKWEDMNKVTQSNPNAVPRYSDFTFDVEEFLKLLERGIAHVRISMKT